MITEARLLKRDLHSRNSLGQKSCRTKVSRIFRIFVPNFAPNFAPNFPRIFRGYFVLRFVGDGDQKKFTKNPRPFSMQNSQANTKKIFTKFFWRAGKVTDSRKSPRFALRITGPSKIWLYRFFLAVVFTIPTFCAWWPPQPVEYYTISASPHRECDWEASISPYLASKHRWESSTASF